jgi:hypothetical protein
MSSLEPPTVPVAGFAARMRNYRTRAGGPSLDILVKLTKELDRPYARSTIDDKLKGRSFPDWEFVEAFVRACARHAGVPDAMVDLDGWRVAHRQSAAAIAAAAEEVREQRRGMATAVRELARVPQDAGFEAARGEYLDRVRSCYRQLNLEVLLTMTDLDERLAVPLREVFVPQRVRADPPPVELPRELRRRLVEGGQAGLEDLPEDLDPQMLARVRAAYRDRPARPVLEVLAEPGGQRVVLLGDPGAGKSTLARYLMLALADTASTDASSPVPVLERIKPRDAAAFEATRQACELVGWDYRRVGTPDPVMTSNLR